MPQLKPGTLIPTEDEGAAPNEAARSDPDSPSLSDAEWEATTASVKLGRHRTKIPKVSTTIRFDADVLAAMKATGPEWQTRINEIPRKSVESQR